MNEYAQCAYFSTVFSSLKHHYWFKTSTATVSFPYHFQDNGGSKKIITFSRVTMNSFASFCCVNLNNFFFVHFATSLSRQKSRKVENENEKKNAVEGLFWFEHLMR